MKKFIFDVDGTLTPSRQKINGEFFAWFDDFCSDNEVYFVTGSDYSKTVEQLGEYLCEKVAGVYNCSGSDVWKKGKNIKTETWKLPQEAHEWLSEQLTASNYNIRTGLHFEHRPGMVNFSVVGRNATLKQRKDYVAYDEYTDERVYIAHNFNLLFPELQAKVGGEISIDIFPKGKDKSQIHTEFDPVKDILYFFGDRMDIDGNDYPLKKVILDKDLGFCYNVKDYKETWKILQDDFTT